MALKRAIQCGVVITGIFGSFAHAALPQSREEFIKIYKDGGAFRDAGHNTIARSKAAVVADIEQFANKCLKVKVSTTVGQGYMTNRSTTTYHTKLIEVKGGVTSLIIQETYRSKPDKSLPPGGLYALVADMRASGGHTRLDIYHAGRTPIAKSITDWAKGDKSRCPKF